MPDTEPKKRGRRKKVVATDAEEAIAAAAAVDTENVPIPSGRRGKRSGKIVNAIALTEMVQSKNVNVILHLKCSLKQIEEYYQTIQWKNDNLTYLPEPPTEIKAYDEPLNNSFSMVSEKEEEPKPKPAYSGAECDAFVCPKCHFQGESAATETISEEDVNHKLKEIKLQFYKNEVDKKSACFWCTYSFDNDVCYILKHGAMGDILGEGSFCSPECSVAYLYNNMKWDDSMKFESYQLINHYYGKPNDYEENIKPAACPYFYLDKFYGNMDIHEYRKLSKSNHMLLTVDKPVTRVLPEIHEDSDKFLLQNNTQMRGNYKVKKQSDKPSVPNRNSILRDSFGLTS